MAIKESKSDDAIITVAPNQAVGDDDHQQREQAVVAEYQSRASTLARKIWGDDARERKYLRKLDGIFLSYVILGHFIKYLDQQNYSNAYVSGMKEDLNLIGNERNLLNTYFNIGIIIGTLPAQMIQLKYVRPSVWIPSCELAWSILVMIMASAKNIQTLYVLRFFIGLLESCAFPGYAAVLGSWYGPSQLAKRMAIFHQTSAIASMFSGYLQAGLYTGLNGALGLAGWRWLFIFDGIISIPIAIWGYFAMPDLPSNTKAFYLNADDRAYGVHRVDKMGRKPPTNFTWKTIKEIYTGWQMWAFIFPFLMISQAATGSNYFNLYLKAKGYSVVEINILPTAGSAVSFVSAFIFGWLSDATGHRLPIIVLVQCIVMISNIIMVVWNLPTSALMAGFYLSYVESAAPIVIAWGYEITQHNANLRQLLVATGNIFAYVFDAWVPVLLFPTQDAPHYKYGYQFLVAFGVLAIAGMYLLDFLDKRERRRHPEIYNMTEGEKSSGDPDVA